MKLSKKLNIISVDFKNTSLQERYEFLLKNEIKQKNKKLLIGLLNQFCYLVAGFFVFGMIGRIGI